MKIYPAIDLFQGSPVRLFQGSYDQCTYYEKNLSDLVKDFENQGAEYLHIVDLQGAKNPLQNQLELIKNMIINTKLLVQVGGGIRSAKFAKELLDAGANRIIIGSLALKDPELFKKEFKDIDLSRIVIAIDAKATKGIDSKIALNGWQSESIFTIETAVKNFSNFGITNFLCTDINKDGTLQGPNFALYKELIQKFTQLNFTLSGGVHCIEDIKFAKNLNIDSCIIGKALYENIFSLKDALLC